MTIIEQIKNVFSPFGSAQDNFVHNPTFDAVLLVGTLGRVPDILRATNGRSYVYFEYMDADALSLARQMGFKPQLHKSRRYFPPRYVYRARIGGNMSKDTLNIALEAEKVDFRDIDKCISNPEYQRYIAANYKMKTK